MGHNSLTWVKQPLNICRCNFHQILHEVFCQSHFVNLFKWFCTIEQDDQCYIPRFSLKVVLILEKKILTVFLPYVGMVVILFNGAEPFEQIDKMALTEDPM